MSGRGTGQRAAPPPHPPPSPLWSEVARGGSSKGESGDLTRAQPPTACSSTPTRPANTNTHSGRPSPTLPPPCAHSQYVAWVHCRRVGIAARLVLDFDGCTEEVTLWSRPSTAGGDSVPDANTATHAHSHHSGKRRRERARRARRREERREARGRCSPPVTPTTGEAAKTAIAPTPPPPVEPPPEPLTSATSTVRARGCKARPLIVKKAKAALAASRASQRAAALAKRRGAAASRISASSDVTPEKVRGGGEDNSLNITDAYVERHREAFASSPSTPRPPSPRPPSPPPPPPPSPPPPSPPPPSPPPSPRCKRCQDCEPDFEEELWRYGRCLNTRNPPWEEVFPLPFSGKTCRFCLRSTVMIPREGDGGCSQCTEMTTFKLVIKYAASYKFRKEYSA